MGNRGYWCSSRNITDICDHKFRAIPDSSPNQTLHPSHCSHSHPPHAWALPELRSLSLSSLPVTDSWKHTWVTDQSTQIAGSALQSQFSIPEKLWNGLELLKSEPKCVYQDGNRLWASAPFPSYSSETTRKALGNQVIVTEKENLGKSVDWQSNWELVWVWSNDEDLWCRMQMYIINLPLSLVAIHTQVLHKNLCFCILYVYRKHRRG